MSEKNMVAESWNENAREWIRIIDTEQIPSRRFTNKAIVTAIRKLNVSRLLDLGCGEGWLTREITKMGKTAVGLDAIETLLENARAKGGEHYYNLSYEEITAGAAIPEAPYEAVVCNFCLYDKDALIPLLEALKNHLSDSGIIVIQTLHPFFLAQQNLEYKGQWLNDAWKGLPGNFKNGHPWYARTFEDWMRDIRAVKMQVTQLIEVVDNYKKPISVIWIAQA